VVHGAVAADLGIEGTEAIEATGAIGAEADADFEPRAVEPLAAVRNGSSSLQEMVMGRITFQKRQKEMKRQEKQRMKAERRAQKKLAKNTESGAQTETGAQTEVIDTVTVSTSSEPESL
jgi:hypothetical protein